MALLYELSIFRAMVFLKSPPFDKSLTYNNAPATPISPSNPVAAGKYGVNGNLFNEREILVVATEPNLL